MTKLNPIEEIKKAISVLFTPVQVVELRGPKCGSAGTISGYFDDHAKLAAAVAELSGERLSEDAVVPAVYVTLNPLARDESLEVANTWTTNARSTTRDKGIERRSWLLVDIDPMRPANTSATEEEKRAAKAIAKEVVAHLRDQEWPDPVVGDSGNGLHLLWQVDLPNDAASTALIKSCLLALAQRFDTDQATVDRSVFNAARVVKCYGSMACKGENTPERPHRLSRLLHVPKRIQVLDRALLESLAADGDSRKGYTAPVKAGLQITPENMEEFLAAYTCTYRRPKQGWHRCLK